MSNYISYINRIIEEADMNGSDCGGSYQSNMKGLYNSMRDFLIASKLEDEYDIEEVGSVYQFVIKGE